MKSYSNVEGKVGTHRDGDVVYKRHMRYYGDNGIHIHRKVKVR